MDSKLPVVNIDALRRDVGKVIVDGEEHLVKQVNGVAYHAFKNAAAGAGEAEVVEAHYVCVEACVPSLPAEKVRALTIEQLQAVLLLALGKIEAVEQAFPNGKRPTKKKRRASSASTR